MIGFNEGKSTCINEINVFRTRTNVILRNLNRRVNKVKNAQILINDKDNKDIVDGQNKYRTINNKTKDKKIHGHMNPFNNVEDD